MQKFSIAVLAIIGAASATNVPSLTLENYDEMTDGKTVFLKFFSPKCHHCTRMAPDWQKLAEEWMGHGSGFVGEVDCAGEGKALCKANGINGFPTMKWGDPSSLEDYQGSRDFKELNEFAKENLKPICSIHNIDLCDDDKKNQIETFTKLSEDELEKMIAAEEAKIDKAEQGFDEAVHKLQQEYEKLVEEKDAAVKAIKTSGLGLLKAVKSHKAKASVKDGTNQEESQEL